MKAVAVASDAGPARPLTSGSPFDGAVVLAGATASGKTALAMALAERLDAEIIGADSLQLYRDVPVASCQPTPADLGRVRHHLVGILAPQQQMTAARFGELARESAAGIRARGRRVLLVGGTGLYLRAALEGLFEGPAADAALRARLTREAALPGGRAALHAQLAAIDPPSAARLSLNDVVRVVRALEIHALTGIPQSEHHRRHEPFQPKVRWLAIDLPRSELHGRIRARSAAIFENVLAEARWLAERQLESCPAARALGIAQALAVECGQWTVTEALEHSVHATRQYAKRQLTWFRAVPQLRWLAAATLDIEALSKELRQPHHPAAIA